jgi:flavin reductase (DIM6/NTAB) family NADH-FMN oxidoreductase RutF
MQVPTDFETAIARRYPEGVAIAIVKDRRGKYNPITLCWVMRTSHQPPMIAISVGIQRYSLEELRASREFVLSIPSTQMAELAAFFGSRSGREVDKLATSGAATQRATIIDGVLLADAVANFECRVEGELQTGDHVIFAGRVVASHMNADASVRGLYALGEERLGGVVPG